MDAQEKSFFCATLADDKQARDLVILELKEASSLADYFIICSGTSDRHVRAIAENIELNMKKRGEKALGVEGLQTCKWVLMDYDDVIIHVFQSEERSFYQLENLWLDCPRIPFEPKA